MADEDERDEAQGREGEESGAGYESRERDEGSQERDDGDDREPKDGESSDRDDDARGDDDEESDGSQDEDDEAQDDDESGDDDENAPIHGTSDEEKRRIEAARKDAEANRERHERADKEAKQREESRQEKRGKRSKILGILLGVVLLIALIGVLISTLGGEAERKASDTEDAPLIGADAVQKRYSGLTQDGFALGEESAPVRIVEFADLQCALCKDVSGTSLPSLIDRYVKTGKARIEFRNYAILGPDSEKAARAAQYAADQGKAWQFIDLFFLNQGRERSGYVTDEFIRKIARGVPGLDPEATVEASNSAAQDTIAAAERQAKRFGVEEAPTFLIGPAEGQLRQLLVQDPRNPGLFAQAIDREIARGGG